MADSNTYFNGFIKEYENISEKYEIGQRLGRGAFADVMLVKDLETSELKAVKVMQLVCLNTTNQKTDNDVKKLQREALLISQLDHPNILKFYECFQFANNFCIVCEYCEEDLTKVLQNHVKNRTRPDKKLAIEWFYDLSRGLKYLHDKKIIHRDIKPSNILFKDNEIKIGDFGESKQILQTMTMMTICGTPQYMSPELFRKSENFTYKTDIWSLGCVFYEIYYLEPAFVGESFNEVKRNVLNRKISYLHKRQNDMTVFKILIDKMLCIDEQQRLSIRRVLSNEIFTDYQTDDIESTDDENIEHPYMQEKKKYFHQTDTTNSTNTVKTKKIFPTIEEYNPNQDNYKYPRTYVSVDQNKKAFDINTSSPLSVQQKHYARSVKQNRNYAQPVLRSPVSPQPVYVPQQPGQVPTINTYSGFQNTYQPTYLQPAQPVPQSFSVQPSSQPAFVPQQPVPTINSYPSSQNAYQPAYVQPVQPVQPAQPVQQGFYVQSSSQPANRGGPDDKRTCVIS